ncbi:MAG: hypothetical protein ACP5D1_09855 [Bacteroidales bacterium]
MDPLEKIIRENRSFFDHREPAEGHLERFSQKLGLAGSSGRRALVLKWSKVAAILVLVLLSSLWIFEHVVRPQEKDLISLGKLSPEYREVELYYTSQIQNKYRELEEWAPDTLSMQIFRREMASMDSIYTGLQKELSAHPGDERVVNAIISYYETRIKVMNYVLLQLKQAQEMKNNEQEQSKPTHHGQPQI